MAREIKGVFSVPPQGNNNLTQNQKCISITFMLNYWSYDLKHIVIHVIMAASMPFKSSIAMFLIASL